MRRMLSLIISVVLWFSFMSTGTAETPRYSIQQLPGATAATWQQTYEAHGRSIEVDTAISIPSADTAPILTVQAAPPIEELLYSQLKAWYTQAKKDDRVNSYAFRSTDFNTAITHATPPAWGDTRDSEFVAGAMGQNQFDLYEFDLNAAYADNNVLTVAEAISIARQQVLLLLPLPALCEESQPVTLKILGGISESIVSAYQAENPNVCIVFDTRKDSFLGLQEALITDDGIDLFLARSDGIYTQVVEKGYAADLSNADDLVQRISALYPWARNLLLQNGRLYAIPVGITCDYWTINRTKWQELGFGDYPRTCDELFRVAEAWEENYAGDYIGYNLFECPDGMPGMLRTMIRQYLLAHEDWSAPVDFDTEEFRTAVQSVLDHPSIFNYDGERLTLIMSYPQYLGTGYNDDDLVESFLPPALTEQVVNASIELLIMNPTSVHQEEAAKFMAFYLENLDPLTAYLLDAFRTEPLRPQNYETARKDLTGQIDTLNSQVTLSDDAEAKKAEELQALQQRLARLDSSWRFSQEDIEIYQTIAAKVVVPTRTIYPMDSDVFSAIFDELTEQLAASSMSVDLFIRLLNEKTRIIFAEMQ